MVDFDGLSQNMKFAVVMFDATRHHANQTAKSFRDWSWTINLLTPEENAVLGAIMRLTDDMRNWRLV